MNPELQKPHFSPEQAPVHYEQNVEFGAQLANPERLGERSHEQEQNMGGGIERTAAQPAPPPMIPIPAPQQVVAMPAPPPTSDNNPVIAADDDLIEKEWVDRAKKIIIETRDDPYKREQEVSKLQADYLRKRYGREIGVST